MSTKIDYSSLKTLSVSISDYVAKVSFARAKKKNSLDEQTFREIKLVFGDYLARDPEVRVILFLGGESSVWCAGIDLGFLQDIGSRGDTEYNGEIGRTAIGLSNTVKWLQSCATAISDNCPKPVIGVAYNMCIGAGLEIFSACDIRYATEDCVFSVREPRIGLAADVGSLQRLPPNSGNKSLAYSLCYTGRDFTGKEAEEKLGFLETHQEKDRSKIEERALALAKSIAVLSPIAIQTTKKSLVYSREHSVADALDHVADLNSCMLQSEDLKKALLAFMTKEKPQFSKL